MYPVLFRIGDFEVTTFGVLVAIAALVGIQLFGRELKRSGLPGDAADTTLAGVIGGLIGAKAVWTLEFLGTQPAADLLFSRGGLSWFGGLVGGVGTGLWMLRRRRVPIVPALAAATPALAVGHAIGRVGCFMVGDDYGRPSQLPWAVHLGPYDLTGTHYHRRRDAGSTANAISYYLGGHMRRFAIIAAAVLLLAGSVDMTAQRGPTIVEVYKSPTCGCCSQWVEHLKRHGFTVRTTDTESIDELKASRGVPPRARSCHTALVGGYVVEGHVPAADVQRLLKERPAIAGIAVPGMPIGSPGMEVPGMKPQPYNVIAFTKDGGTRVFASH